MPSIPVVPPPQLHHASLAWNSAELLSTSWTVHQFPSPDFSFTSGLKFHQRAGNPTQAQPKAAITSTACGHSSCVNTKVGSCHSQLQHLITATLLALNYGNTSRDFWVASTQSVTSSTTYITNLLCQAVLINFWDNCHETQSYRKVKSTWFHLMLWLIWIIMY